MRRVGTIHGRRLKRVGKREMGRHLKRIPLGERARAVKHPLSGGRSCRYSDPLARLNGTTCLSQNQLPVMPTTKDDTRSCRDEAVAILLYCFFQFWRFLGCHLPHDLVVYTEISVDQLIAHPGHRSSLDVRMPRPNFGREALRGPPITSMLRTKARFNVSSSTNSSQLTSWLVSSK